MQDNELSTKQRILASAVNLFAEKGFTETSMRELADAVGLNVASLYNHFPSKNAILDFILEDFLTKIANTLHQDKLAELKTKPSADGIVSCLMLGFPPEKADYYLKVLFVMLHEQYRNSTVGKLMSEQIIMGGEQVIRTIIDELIKSKVLAEGTDPDFWAKAHSSLVYSFSCRRALGIGDNSPDFSGMSMVDMLRNLYDLMLKTCKA